MKSLEEQIGINGAELQGSAVNHGRYTQGRNLSFIALIIGWVASTVFLLTGFVLIIETPETYVGIGLIFISLALGLSSALFAKIIEAYFDMADNIQSIKEHLVTPKDASSK